MKDTNKIMESIESSKALFSIEIPDDGLLRTDLARLLAQSFEMAHKSLAASTNKTN
jgi:hypothetical protein